MKGHDIHVCIFCGRDTKNRDAVCWVCEKGRPPNRPAPELTDSSKEEGSQEYYVPDND